MPTLDDTDRDIIMRRAHKYDTESDPTKPRIGDYVVFSDGMLHRVSHIWDDGVQTSRGGSFHLGDGYISFSGGLEPSIPFSDLELTDEKRLGQIWIEHHGWLQKDSAVYDEIPFRVYRANRPTHERYCHDCSRMVPGNHPMGADGRHYRPRRVTEEV
jgi:hypothetical protein